MSRSRLYSLLSHVHRTRHADANGLPDAELLERFARLRDEAAFELLVWRHERLVLGVCRRVLRDEHDAEDAFQATFLTLARKAASIGRREAVASWLYKVAYHCALRMREIVQRQRQGFVSSVDPANVARPDPDLAAADHADLRDILDEEVRRLPAKYRTAIVLCYLEGKSYQQAANELGCPAGTLSARLHTARERLRVRLTARGIAPAIALAVLESSGETHAAARLALVAVQAAQRIIAGQNAADVVSSRTLELATGVGQAMSASKPKIIVLVMLMGCLSGLTSWTMLRALPQAPREQPAEKADKPVSPKKRRIMATWQECARLRGAIGKSIHVEFTPDGGALAAIDGDDILRVWNTSDWEQRWQYDLRHRYGGNFQPFMSFSPDGRLLGVLGVAADGKKPGQSKKEVTLLDVANGRELACLAGDRLYYAPDKATLATWQNDSVILWDARTFRKKREFKAGPPPDGVSFWIDFSKDASLIGVPTKAGRCHLWETATGKERARPLGFLPGFSPDGKTLMTLLPGGVIKLWDTANGRERAAIRKAGRTGCFAMFSADSKLVLVWASSIGLKANGDPDLPERAPEREARILPIDVCLYDAATGEERKCLPGRLSGEDLYDVVVQFTPDGRTVAYTRLEADQDKRQEVVLWDVPSGRERAVLRTSAGVRTPQFSLATSFSPDSAALLTTDASLRNLRLWDVATGRRLLDLPAEVGFVHFSPDGQWLAGVPGHDGGTAGDIRVFHRSDHPLPPPVIRGEAVKPRPPQR